MITPTRSSRRYTASKATSPIAVRQDRPMIPMVPAANTAASAYPLPAGLAGAYDLVLRSLNGPDRGTTLP